MNKNDTHSAIKHTCMELCLFVSLVFFAFACNSPQKYDEIPAISFQKLRLSDGEDALGNKIKLLKLTFKLTDGDGNIGLKLSDTIGKFHPDSLYANNLFTTLYKIENGEEIKLPAEKQRNFKIPYLEPQGQNKNLICTVEADIDFAYTNNGKLPYDSVRFRFYVVDRTQNKSNEEQTPIFKLDTIGVFN